MGFGGKTPYSLKKRRRARKSSKERTLRRGGAPGNRSSAHPGVGLVAPPHANVPSAPPLSSAHAPSAPPLGLTDFLVFSQAAKSQKAKLENDHDLSGYFDGVPFKIFQPIDDFYHTTTIHFINEFNGTLKQMIDEFTSRLVTFFSKEMVALSLIV